VLLAGIAAVLIGMLAGAGVGWALSRGRVERWTGGLLEQWRTEESESLGAATVQRSQAVLKGRVWEQLAPVHPAFGFDPADARFLGSPVDFVIFDGYADVKAGRRQSLRSVVLLDVKTGGSGLTTVQRRVRDCLQRGEVSWTIVGARDADD